MNRHATGLLIAASFAGAIPSAAHPQTTGCPACLDLDVVVELSSEGGPIVPSGEQDVLRMPDARYLVSHRFTGGPQFAVYDSTGRFVAVYDRPGEGPGELRSGGARLFAGPPGSIWVLNAGRLLRLDPDLQPLETRALEAQIIGSRSVVLPEGLVVVNRRTVDATGPVVRLVLADSVGGMVQAVEGIPPRSSATILAPAHGGGFWTVDGSEPVLRRHSAEGGLERTSPFDDAHLDPWRDATPTDGFVVLRHAALYDAGEGVIVVFTHVLDPEGPPTPTGMFAPSEMDLNEHYDTFVAVVDLGTGERLATRRLDDRLLPVDGAPDLFYSTHLDELGHARTRIVRVGWKVR
jgi:hypothetical protein